MNCIFDCKSVKSLDAKDLHVSALDDSVDRPVSCSQRIDSRRWEQSRQAGGKKGNYKDSFILF